MLVLGYSVIITCDLPVIRRNHNIDINLKFSSQARRQTRKLASTVHVARYSVIKLHFISRTYPVSQFPRSRQRPWNSLRECEKTADNGRYASLNLFVILKNVLKAYSFLLHYISCCIEIRTFVHLYE